MRITFMRQRKGEEMKAIRGSNSADLPAVVREVMELLDRTATDLVRTDQNDLRIYSYDTVTSEPVCDVYHGFFDEEHNDLALTSFLYKEMGSRLSRKGLVRYKTDFSVVYMSDILANLRLDLETRLKAFFVVACGGVCQREDVERLIKMDWKDLIAAIRIAQDEGMSAVEVLDFIEQPAVAA